jgi:O-antigen biosynthesis protein
MTFWEHFLRLLPKRPVPALAALYWHLTRRRVRARNRLRAASADLPFTYRVWIATKEKDADIRADFAAQLENWSCRPTFSILMIYGPNGHSRKEFDRSISSINQQVYPAYERLDITGATPMSGQLTSVRGEFVVPVHIGDALAETALFRFAEALQLKRARILYGDEDELDDRGSRIRPWFKPRWNREMFLAQDYLSSAVAVEARLANDVLAANECCDLDDLLLEATSVAEDSILHVPHIVCHVGARIKPAHCKRVAAVGRHLECCGASSAPGPFETVKVEWPLPRRLPLVSIIVPTKDKVSLLRPCIDSVLKRTDYPSYEILIVDNGSVELQTAKYLAEVSRDPRIRVLNYPKPYNFSAINNFAVCETRGSFLCLLNNDTEVVETTWLTEMMRYAVRPEIAAVGAKLLYDDGSIQHAGVVVGISEAAGHAHRFLAAGKPGYFQMPHVAQFVTAVTAACLVVEKRKFERVGGLDEQKLAVAFNDVDFCLKLQAAGWRNVYVPHAVLLHHESKSRGDDSSPSNIERYRGELATLQKRWGTKTYEDPLHNPNLDRYCETFVLRL